MPRVSRQDCNAVSSVRGVDMLLPGNSQLVFYVADHRDMYERFTRAT